MLQEMFRQLGDRIVVGHAKDVRAAAKGTDLPAAGQGVLDYPLYLRLLAQLNRPMDLIIEHLTLPDVVRARDFVLVSSKRLVSRCRPQRSDASVSQSCRSQIPITYRILVRPPLSRWWQVWPIWTSQWHRSLRPTTPPAQAAASIFSRPSATPRNCSPAIRERAAPGWLARRRWPPRTISQI